MPQIPSALRGRGLRRLGRPLEVVRDRTLLFADVRSDSSFSRAARTFLRDHRVLATYWWNTQPNFGDILGPNILRGLAGVRPRHVSMRARGKFLSLGSVLSFALPGDTVWGTGSIREERIDLRGVRVLAVRGPKSRALAIGDVPEIYGDPALLLPRFYTPRTLPRFEVGVVPHASDSDIMRSTDPRVRVIDVRTTDWQRVVDEITSCDVILSSSLHGIIVAEAFGVPAVWIKASDRLHGGDFKFLDYYESTNRFGVKPRSWSPDLTPLVKGVAAPPEFRVDRLLAVLCDHVSQFAK